jgi:hypothetical protein
MFMNTWLTWKQWYTINNIYLLVLAISGGTKAKYKKQGSNTLRRKPKIQKGDAPVWERTPASVGRVAQTGNSF